MERWLGEIEEQLRKRDAQKKRGERFKMCIMVSAAFSLLFLFIVLVALAIIKGQIF